MRPRPASPFRGVLGVVAGFLTSCLLAEGLLRLFVTPSGPPPPQIRRDALDLPAVTSRQIEEGVGTAHFSAAGARLTGNAPVADAPVAVIIGDSYVVAREIPDEATMGGWLERTARAEHRPLNVRQYGWRGASPARYVVASTEVLSRWDPAVVFIPLSDDDFDDRAVGGSYPWLHIGNDGNATVVSDPAGEQAPTTPPISVLAVLLEQRWRQLVARAPRALRPLVQPAQPTATSAALAVETSLESPPQPEIIPSAVVRALKRAYGDRLVLLYVADVRVSGGEQTTDTERRMLTACAEQRVTCESTRQIMLSAREHGIVSRGFSTTTLGVGHMNRDGHRLVASEMWRLIQPHFAMLSAK